MGSALITTSSSIGKSIGCSRIKSRPDNAQPSVVVVLFVGLLILAAAGCRKSGPADPPSESPIPLTLSLDFRESTMLWYKIGGGNVGDTLRITRTMDSVTVITSIIADSMIVHGDTLMLDTSLAPGKAYAFSLALRGDGRVKDSIGSIVWTTLDTTSHGFTWSVDTFGVSYGSTLEDVWGLDENQVWAVGHVYIGKDSGGTPQYHNAYFYDGMHWGPRDISFSYYGGFASSPPLHAIHGFAPNDIWVVTGMPIHGDGSNWQLHDVRNLLPPGGSTTTIWGSSSRNMFAAGFEGTMIHYNGKVWQRMELGVRARILSIWGFDSTHVFASGYDQATGILVVFMYDGISWSPYLQDVMMPDGRYLNGTYFTVFGFRKDHYFVAGSSAYEYLQGTWKKILGADGFEISGPAPNDLLLAGDIGKFHWNGISWHAVAPELSSPFRRKQIGADIFEVGAFDEGGIVSKAYILHGRR